MGLALGVFSPRLKRATYRLGQGKAVLFGCRSPAPYIGWPSTHHEHTARPVLIGEARPAHGTPRPRRLLWHCAGYPAKENNLRQCIFPLALPMSRYRMRLYTKAAPAAGETEMAYQKRHLAPRHAMSDDRTLANLCGLKLEPGKVTFEVQS